MLPYAGTKEDRTGNSYLAAAADQEKNSYVDIIISETFFIQEVPRANQSFSPSSCNTCVLFLSSSANMSLEVL